MYWEPDDERAADWWAVWRVAAIVGLILLVVWLVGCRGSSSPPLTTPASPITIPFATRSCSDIWAQELGRSIDPQALTACVGQFRAGVTGEVIRDGVRASAEWKEVHKPKPARALMRGRLHVDGRRMVYSDGQRFPYRGLMAFTLGATLAAGDETAAKTYLAYARDRGFTVVRVLAMLPNGGWATLSVEDGRRILGPLFALAKTYDLYVQIVALANTGPAHGSRAFLEDQVRTVGAACAAVENCLLEIANEPYHPTQASLVHDFAVLRQLRTMVPREVPTALGAPDADEGPEAVAAAKGADFVVLHLDRGRDRWNRVRRVRELEMVSADARTFVVDNEPMGAAEAPEAGRRDTEPQAFYLQGVLSRIFGVGSTFHCSACLLAQVPGPVQDAAARAFITGATLWRDGWDFTFANTGWATSPIAKADFTRVVRAYSATSQGRWWTVLVGVTGDPQLVFQNGFRHGPALQADGPVQVFEAVR